MYMKPPSATPVIGCEAPYWVGFGMFGVFAGSSPFGLSSNFHKNILSDMNPSMDISSLGLTNLHAKKLEQKQGLFQYTLKLKGPSLII